MRFVLSSLEIRVATVPRMSGERLGHAHVMAGTLQDVTNGNGHNAAILSICQ